MSIPTLDPAARDKLIVEARRKLALEDFSFFCNFVVTEEGPLPRWLFQEEIISLVSRNESFIWLKRRQIMASWLMAAASVWVALHPAHHVGIFSKDEDETRELVRRAQLILRNLPDWLRVTHIGSDPMRIKHPNNMESVIQPYAATAAGGVGRSFKFVIFDEFAFHPYGKTNLAAVLPAVQNSNGMVAITSTSNPELSQAGAMYDMWLASVNSDNGFTPVFSNRYCRPDQDEAVLELFRTNSPDEETFSAFYPVVWQDAFTARQGLVYGRDKEGNVIFDHERNRRKPEVPWRKCLWRMVGIDPGGNDPSAVVPVGVWKPSGQLHPYTDRYHAYGSYHSDVPMSVGDLEDILKEINAKGRIHFVLVDPSQRMVGESLADRGWPVEMANNDRSVIFSIQDLFKRGQLTINPDDEGLLDEIMTTEWARPSGEFAYSAGRRTALRTRTPSRHHADRLDAMRYAIAAVRDYYPRARAGDKVWTPTLKASQVLVKSSGVLA